MNIRLMRRSGCRTCWIDALEEAAAAMNVEVIPNGSTLLAIRPRGVWGKGPEIRK